jgi:TonB family protein
LAYDPAPMRRVLVLLSLVVVCRCAAPPAPEVVPEPVAPLPAVVKDEEKVIGSVRVTASALNVRAEASTEASVVAQIKKGVTLDVLREEDAWMKVRLASGETGWVASRFVTSGSAPAKATKAAKPRKSGCPADSDYAFTETPTLAFSESGAHGMVVVEATVSAKGTVTATKVVTNGTGDDALAFLAEREIKGAKFSPPIRNCAPRAFIFTYRRTF